MKNIFLFFLFATATFCTFFASMSLGQKAPITNGKKVEILSADSLGSIKEGEVEIRTLYNNVKLRQEDINIYCSRASMNGLTGVVEAYGKVRIVKGDSITVLSDTAIYYSFVKQAKLNGKVSMNDKIMTLTTKRLDYDMANGLAYYTEKGKIVDKENTLTSKEGYYNTRTKEFNYKRNVKLVGKAENKKPFNLSADSLRYITSTKIAYFIAPTRIVSEKDTMFATKGWYDTKIKSLFLTSRSTARNEEYDMVGDTVYYDRITQKGVMYGNAKIISRKDSIVITGDYGYYAGKEGISRMIGKKALLRNIINKDTLYVSADTLLSVENKEQKTRKLYAYKHVLIYKKDLQGKCDSLIYNTQDSTISFYKKPILWNDGNQSEADSIIVQMINNKIRMMNMKGKSFVISTDSLGNYNQVKGRKITANFTTLSKLDRVFVEGNGESIFFALDDKQKMVGMNRVQCSKLTLYFKDSKAQRSTFVGKPDAEFMPPKKITEDNKHLQGFRWRANEKPTQVQVLNGIQPTINKKDNTDKNTVKQVQTTKNSAN
jgi:lipopolysaccharide export system protein LptA